MKLRSLADRKKWEPRMRRKGERIRTQVPVRLYGMDCTGKPFNVAAVTVDISANGARVSGINLPLTAGDIVGIQRGIEKERCRVVWVGEQGDLKGSIGLSLLQAGRRFWGRDFGGEPDTWGGESASPPVPALARPSAERRKSRRYACSIGAELIAEGSAMMLWGHCTDLSGGGCYVETRSPMPKGSRLEIRLRSEIAPFKAGCIVCSSHPLLGMGLQFVTMSTEDAKTLGRLLTIAASIQPDASTPARSAPSPQNAKLNKLRATLKVAAETVADCVSDPEALAEFRRSLVASSKLADEMVAVLRESRQKEQASALNSLLSRHRIDLLNELIRELARDLASGDVLPSQLAELIGALKILQGRLSDFCSDYEVHGPAIAQPPDILQFPSAHER